jgi:hypothetical protein
MFKQCLELFVLKPTKKISSDCKDFSRLIETKPRLKNICCLLVKLFIILKIISEEVPSNKTVENFDLD